MSLQIPITDRARKWGYVFWSKKLDRDVLPFLGQRQQVDVWFEHSNLGTKNVDYDHRRISIGYKLTRKLPANVSTFVLSIDRNGKLTVKCQ